jgi:hypothetical protein
MHTHNNYSLGVKNDKHAFSIPPYGNDGGSTSRSYTPNRYDVTIFSSAARNLQVMRWDAIQQHRLRT